MARGYPSMTALLGLLAVAGYQNRDKIAEMLRGATSGPTPSHLQPAGGPGTPQPSALEQIFGGLGGMFGVNSAASGGLISNGLNELIKQFSQNGKGEVAKSWVHDGPNQPISPTDLERAIGEETLATLTQQTGLSRDEVLSRLSRELPDAVDRYTPDGNLPSARDAHA
jgi:uncharacterized protein YidB (DUF937 family)